MSLKFIMKFFKNGYASSSQTDILLMCNVTTGKVLIFRIRILWATDPFGLAMNHTNMWSLKSSLSWEYSFFFQLFFLYFFIFICFFIIILKRASLRGKLRYLLKSEHLTHQMVQSCKRQTNLLCLCRILGYCWNDFVSN